MPDEFLVKGEAHPASRRQPSLPVVSTPQLAEASTGAQGTPSTPASPAPQATSAAQTLPAALATPAALAIHNNFRNAVRGLRRELVRTIYYLRVIHDRNIFRALGYTSIRTYAAEHGGLTEGQCKAFLRIGAKLDDLPAMKRALAEGSLTWRKANAIVGEADPENEQELVNLACGLSETALQAELASPAPPASPMALPQAPPQASPLAPSKGAPPSAGPQAGPQAGSTPKPEPTVRPADEPCYVTFKFTAEQYSLWAAFNARKSGRTKEDALTAALTAPPAAAPVNGPQAPAEGPATLIVLQVCPACRRGALTNNRGAFEAPTALLETAFCDAIVEGADARRRRIVSHRLRRKVLQRDNFTCQAAGCPHAQHLQIHHRLPVAQGGETVLENLVTLCAGCHRRLHEQDEELRKANRDPVA